VTRTEQVAEYIACAASTALDPGTAELGRRHLLDTLAAVVACRDLDAGRVARAFAASRSGGAGAPASGARATMLGTNDRALLVDAAFAGAMTAHGAEINDFIPSVFVQPGPSIVAVALAVGEHVGASGLEVLGAMVAGYEIAARVPRALGVDNLRRAGLANHGVGSCFGAAAAAAALWGLAPERIVDVLSATAQQAAGSWQWLLDVQHIEKAFVFAGMGARNGLDAVLLVAAGYRGVLGVLDRPGTWFTAPPFTRAGGDGDLDELVDGLGTRSILPGTAFKRYPVGGPAQPAVEALLHLRRTSVASADDVDRVVIEMPGHADAFRDAAMPALNLRYLCSVILLDGELDFVTAQSLTRMRTDGTVAELMTRVDVRHDPVQEAAPGAPRAESARVTIEGRDGSTHQRFVPHVLGFPSHPMDAGAVEAKAIELMAPCLGDDRAQDLVHATRDLGSTSAAGLVELVASDGRQPRDTMTAAEVTAPPSRVRR
jgi:2-methylcitrate dehydratase PrpD